jgi:hypothetical protein
MRLIGAEKIILSKRKTISPKHDNLNVFSILAVCLVLGLCQAGCIGVAGSNAAGNPTLGTSPLLIANPDPLSFGMVGLGSSMTKNVTIANSGTATLTISKASISGTGFSIVGGSPSISIPVGQAQAIQVQFAPLASGASAGSLIMTSDDPASPTTVPLSGSGGQPQLTYSPGSLSFGNVSVGGSASQTVTISNGGTAALTINSLAPSGAGYSMIGITAPITVNAGQSIPFTATFAPTSAGVSTGGVSATSNAPNSPQAMSFTGTGVTSASALNANPTSIAFGNVNVGANSSQNIVLSNAGAASVTISQISTIGTGFSSSGITVPITLTAGQSATLATKYAPASAGGASGSVTVTSNASNPNLAISLTGTGIQTQPQIAANPTSVAFGNVVVGGSLPQTITLSNSGNAALNITQITAAGTGYSVTGFTLPISIAPGASSPITATFAPTSTGSPSGIISITSNAPSSPTTIAMTGTGIQSDLTASPASISYGNVPVGSSGSQTVTLNNTGSSSLTISALSASGAGYSVTGFTLPISIAAGANTTFTAKFTPTATGNSTGGISITSTAPGSPLTIAMTGIGAQGQITPNPASVSFGNVLVGANSSQTVSLTNNGSGSVTISNVAASGTGYSISGVATLPLTLTTGQSTSFTATFTPASPTSPSGSIAVTSNGSNPNLSISMTGTGIQPAITATPSTIGFGNVVVGLPNSQTIKIQNTGTATLTISQASVTGTGFSLSGLTTPMNIAAGGNATFNVAFGPNSAGAVNGSLSLTNNSGTSPILIPLSGTGVAATYVLNASATSLSFGNVNVGSNSTLNVTLTNAGNSTVTVLSVTPTGTGYSASGVSAGLQIAAGATATLNVTFTPTSAATVPGNITIGSNATNPAISITLSGTGVQSAQHSVSLTWTASTSTVVGYNVYRGSVSGGPYTLITSAPVAGTAYTDLTVQAGQTYFYVVTAVDASGNESVFSNEVSATIPTP